MMYEEMGEIFKGSILRCDECGTKRELSTKQAAYYMEHGWPLCCEYTMRVITARERCEPQEGI